MHFKSIMESLLSCPGLLLSTYCIQEVAWITLYIFLLAVAENWRRAWRSNNLYGWWLEAVLIKTFQVSVSLVFLKRSLAFAVLNLIFLENLLQISVCVMMITSFSSVFSLSFPFFWFFFQVSLLNFDFILCDWIADSSIKLALQNDEGWKKTKLNDDWICFKEGVCNN